MAIAEMGSGESDIFPLDMSKKPTIISVAPQGGVAGDRITITGEGFMLGFIDGTTVKIGGFAATGVAVLSATKLNAIVPLMPAGEFDVVVTNPDGESAVLSKGFVTEPGTGFGESNIFPLDTSKKPAIVSVTPQSGSAGTKLTIIGEGFMLGFIDGTTVKIGGFAATKVAIVSTTKLTATIPPMPAMEADVVVTNPDGESAILTRGFVVEPVEPGIGFEESNIFPLDTSKKPAILSVVPKSGAVGDKITITGDGFMTGFVEGTIVKISGNIAADVTIVSTTELNATVPPMSEGEADVAVTIPYGESATLAGGFVVEEVTTQTEIVRFDGSSLVVRADDLTPTDGGGVKASKNITINHFLGVDGSIQIDKERKKISGSGTVKMLSVPFIGDVELYKADKFEMDASDVDLVNFAGVETKLTIGYLSYELEIFTILDNGLEFAGNISMPEGVYLASVDNEGKETVLAEEDSKVAARVSITQDKGIEFLGGEIRIKKLALGHTGYRLEDVHFVYQKERNLFEGGAKVAIPHLFIIEGSLGIAEGRLNKVGIGVDELNKPILHAPPVFLQRIYGELDELSPGNPPIILKAETAMTLGPQIQGKYIVRAEVRIDIDTSGTFTGDGTLYILSDECYMSAEITVDVEKGVSIEGNLNIFDVVDADGKLKIDLQNNFQGKVVGVLKAPDNWPFIGGNEFGSTTFYVDNTKIAAGVQVGFFNCGVIYAPYFDYGAAFNFFDGLQFPANLRKITDVKFNRSHYAMRNRNMRASQQQDIHIPAGLPVAIFRVEWSEGDMDFQLVDPTGNTINKDSMAESPQKYFYRKNLKVPEAYYAVKEPAEGGWQVVIPDVASVGDYRIEVLGGNHAPKVSISNVSAGEAITVNWTDKDQDDNAKVSLYYDTDNADMNGSLIATDIPEDEESDSYAWTPDDTVPSGTYYIYAKIDDGVNVPQFSYSTETVTIQNSKSPQAPTNFQSEISGTDIKLSWDNSPSKDVEGYVIYCTDKPHAVTYDSRLAVGSQTEYTLQELPSGRVYRISVTAYNTDGRESVCVTPIEIAFNATNINNPPQIVSVPSTNAKVGIEYTYQVDGTDVDGDTFAYTLVDVPDGMKMDEPTGVVSWIPSTSQVGNYDVKIRLDDAHGGVDEQSYTIIVADKANYMPEAMLISPKIFPIWFW